ncbi:hypothetical protein EV421DRAFT_1912393 [Armillaria borealis]|uniref:Uncharacterized protein n=1 Tax=Armillaria borealis TaxID=47425 RepID=A0AA39IWN5_9AGAR|nr:hypothetical protein EV421DRAFT_1912393 [Armillaria borealis]
MPDLSYFVSPTGIPGLDGLGSSPTATSRCAAEDNSAFSHYSALDSVWGGVNDWLAKGPAEGQVGVLVSEKLDADGKSEGAEGRLVVLDGPLPVNQLMDSVKTHLGLSQCNISVLFRYSRGLMYARSSSSVCADLLVGRDADVYHNGDMSDHEALALAATAKHVILSTRTLNAISSVPDERLRRETQVDEPEIVVSEEDTQLLLPT